MRDKEEDIMHELTEKQQDLIVGEFGVGTVLVCIVVSAGVYKIITSTKGKISIPWFISLEWSR